MKKNFFLIIAVMIFLFIFIGNAFSENAHRSKTVEVMGFSRINERNELEAQKIAESYSLNIAIQNVLVDLLSTRIIISNFKEITNIIKKYNNDFILNYKVLAQYIESDIYYIFIKANVSINQILLKLSEEGIIIDALKMPSIVIFIAEKNVLDTGFKYWWNNNSFYQKTTAELALERVIIKRGYYIINHNQFQYSSGIPQNHNLSDEEAATIGLNMGAKVVIIGEATAVQSGGMVEDRKCFTSRVKLRALRSGNHNVLAKSENTSTTLNLDKELGGQAAIEKSIKIAGDDLVLAIMKNWHVEKLKPTIIKVNIVGENNYFSYLVKLLQMLRNMDGINNVEINKVSIRSATLVINYKGDVQKLAERMVAKTYKNFFVNIFEVTNDSMNIELVSK